MSAHFYLYRLDDPETGEFYFGSRKCFCLPVEDTYMGSMKTWKPDKSKLIKTIIKSDFTSHEDLIRFETNIIREHIKDPLNRNNSIPIAPFHIVNKDDVSGENNGFYGKHHTEDHKKRVSEKLKGNKNPSYGKRWINKDGIQKYVKEEQVSDFLSEGWKLGALMSGKAFKCKRIWITNGSQNKYIKEEELEIPDGWRIGKTYSSEAKEKFKNNLQKNSDRARDSVARRLKSNIYINNGSENLRLTHEEAQAYFQRGWKRGRWQPAWNKKISSS